MKVQLTVASCDGSRILNLQQFTDLKVINNLASNEVVEPVYKILINTLYDEVQRGLDTLDDAYAKSKASLEQYLITAQNGGNAEFLQGYSPVNFIRSENTINELVNSATGKYKVGDVVEVLGYYTAGDGAHHKRKIESADDGSGVQLANGLWANIVHNGEVNVSWFGIAKETTGAFLLNVFNGIISNLKIYKVSITGSFFLKDNKFNLEINRPLIIDFNNNKVTMDNTFRLKICDTENVVVKNAEFEFVRSLDTTHPLPGVRFLCSRAKNLHFSNLKFINTSTDSHTFDMGDCNEVHIKYCEFYGASDNTVNNKEYIQVDVNAPAGQPGQTEPYSLKPSSDIYIDSCIFGDSETMSGKTALGSHGTSDLDVVFKNIFVTNCVFNYKNTRNKAIYAINLFNIDITVEGCTFLLKDVGVIDIIKYSLVKDTNLIFKNNTVNLVQDNVVADVFNFNTQGSLVFFDNYINVTKNKTLEYTCVFDNRTTTGKKKIKIKNNAINYTNMCFLGGNLESEIEVSNNTVTGSSDNAVFNNSASAESFVVFNNIFKNDGIGHFFLKTLPVLKIHHNKIDLNNFCFDEKPSGMYVDFNIINSNDTTLKDYNFSSFKNNIVNNINSTKKINIIESSSSDRSTVYLSKSIKEFSEIELKLGEANDYSVWRRSTSEIQIGEFYSHNAVDAFAGSATEPLDKLVNETILFRFVSDTEIEIYALYKDFSQVPFDASMLIRGVLAF